MPINVSAAIDSDTAEIVTVERTSSGGYVDGIYVSGTVTTFKTLSSVQQPTTQDLQMLPEGDRDANPRLFISKKLLRMVSDRDNLVADVVLYKGLRFKIIALGDWISYGHNLAFGVRVQ
jgi:hypothetical protein